MGYKKSSKGAHFIMNFLSALNGLVWGPATIFLILSVGIVLTVKTRFVQIFHLRKALSLIFKNDGKKGEISPFASLCTTLSATIGTGNIIGVAVAVKSGGAGALFWMLVSAFFGMATNYSEGLLAVKYRISDPKGNYCGGPFYYIEKGLKEVLGENFPTRWLGVLFSFFAILTCLFGMGTLVQSNGIFLATKQIFNTSSSSLLPLSVGVAVVFLASPIIFGGGKAVSRFSSVLVPFMSVSFLVFSFIIIFSNITNLLPAIKLIFASAFSTNSVLGAASGITISEVVKIGVSKGIFSNEAGLGTAPIAAASSKSKSPVNTGLVTMTGTFIDTFVICLITGLCVVMTESYTQKNLIGFDIAAHSWKLGLPFSEEICVTILSVCLIFFAFATIIGWSFYAEKCLYYILGRYNKTVVTLFRILYIIAVGIGPFLTPSSAFIIADIFNGLMAFPNLTALLLMSNIVKEETQKGLKSSGI